MAILNKVTAARRGDSGGSGGGAANCRRRRGGNAASCCGLGSVMSVEAKCVQLELSVISRRP